MDSKMKNKYIIRFRISQKKFKEFWSIFLLRLSVPSLCKKPRFRSEKITDLCQIRHQSLCKIFKQIRILITKECEKSAKRSFFRKWVARLKLMKVAFLLPYTRNCVVEVVRRVCSGRRIGRKSFLPMLRVL